MGSRAIILVGDKTSHGGTVLEGSATVTVESKGVASVGDKVSCPQCKGVFTIAGDLLGRQYPHRLTGRDTAVDGMRTTCGAVLIASQSVATIEDVGAGAPSSGATAAATVSGPMLSPTLCLECLKAAADSAATTVMRD